MLPVDLASFSAHKIYGPKGVGFLYVSEQAQLHPLQFGGNQERAVRGGTENAPGIVGMAEAVRLAVSRISEQQRHGNQLKAAFIEQLTSLLKADPIINGSMDTSLPHILNISFPGISAETMLMNLDLDGIAAASGSACTSGSMKPSHVLQAMGLQKDRVQSAIRFSFGKQTTLADIRTTSTAIATIVNRIRK